MTNPYPEGPGNWQRPGQQYPQQYPPYQQPGQYQQPNPYGQPGQHQQPNPYDQPGQHQQPNPYGQPPFFPPPKKSSKAWIFIAAGAVLAIVLSVGTFFFVRSGQGRSENTPTTNAQAQQSLPPKPTTPPPPPAPGHGKPGPNTPAGWQTVSSPSGLDFDVPGDWKLEKPSAIIGWEKPCPNGPFGFCVIRTLQNVATRAHPPGEGCTDNSSSAIAGFPVRNPSQIPLEQQKTIGDALEAEARIVPDIYTDWGKDASAPHPPPPPAARSDTRQFTVGGAPALQTTFTLTGLNTSVNCNPPSSLYGIVSTTSPAGAVVTFVVVLDQGYPQAADPGILQKIIDTLRPSL